MLPFLWFRLVTLFLLILMLVPPPINPPIPTPIPGIACSCTPPLAKGRKSFLNRPQVQNVDIGVPFWYDPPLGRVDYIFLFFL